MYARLPLTCFFLVFFFVGKGQLPLERELIRKIEAAGTDEIKITVLGELAEFYSIYRDNKKADSILAKQLLLAEASQNEELISKTLSSNAINNTATWSNKESFDRAMSFLQKGLNYAKERNNKALLATVYIKLAGILRKRKLPDQAMVQATLAFANLGKNDDSLRTILHLEIGDIFLSKGDAVSAYQNYNSAYDIAYTSKDIQQQSAAWHRYSTLYTMLGDSTLAKGALMESLQLNIKENNAHGLLVDYIDLFRQTDELEFLKKSLFLADSLKSIRYQVYCKRLMFTYLIVVKQNSEQALAYLEGNPDLKTYINNEGLPNYNIGTVYHYSGKFAEAIHYYLKDEPTMLQNFEPSVQSAFFLEVADCYSQLDSIDKAIEYNQEALTISKTSDNVNTNASITLRLSKLFSRKNDYKNAFDYTQLYFDYNNEQKKLARQREVALLGLEREKTKHIKDLELQAMKDLKKRNLQYMGISLATTFLFLLLFVFGMFPTSKVTIRMLNFFAFICLFELIILLIDNWLHHATHGEPLKIWLAKIFIIAMLLPLHHTLEHVAIRFLSSQKLQHFREKFTIKKIFHPTKKTVEKIEKNLEESTLV